MFRKILAPLDGSPLAECVLPHVTAIGSAYQAEVVLLRIIEGGVGTAKQPADPLSWEMRRIEVTAYLEGVRSRLEALGIETTIEVLEGSAARKIVDYARAQDCDLLALSTHGSSGLAPWSMGSVASKVIEQSKTSLLLVRAFDECNRETTMQRYGRIMVGLDGSQRAEAVLPTAITLAEHSEGELLLVHVVPRAHGFRERFGAAQSAELAIQLVERNAAEASAYLRRLQTRLPVGSDVHVAVSDNVMVSLEEEAAREEVDLVLVSAHGWGGDRHRRYGRVIGETMHYGSAPLLVVQDMPAEQIVATLVEEAVQESAEISRWRLPRPTTERLSRHAA